MIFSPLTYAIGNLLDHGRVVIAITTQYLDECVLDLLYFFYTHENLDFYDNVQFDKIAKSLYMQYGIGKGDLLKMFSDFRKLVYEV